MLFAARMHRIGKFGSSWRNRPDSLSWQVTSEAIAGLSAVIVAFVRRNFKVTKVSQPRDVLRIECDVCFWKAEG